MNNERLLVKYHLPYNIIFMKEITQKNRVPSRNLDFVWFYNERYVKFPGI